MHVPVRVLFRSARPPHTAKVFVQDFKTLVIYWMNPDIIPATALPWLELATNAEAEHWAPVEEPRPTPVRIRLVS